MDTSRTARTEAAALAIATCRAWTLATDDRLAIRYAQDLGASLVTTPEFMKRWAEATQAAPAALRRALQRVESRARFTPSAKFPLYEWWLRAAGASD